MVELGGRTPDLIIANDALSQLSYSPERRLFVLQRWFAVNRRGRTDGVIRRPRNRPRIPYPLPPSPPRDAGEWGPDPFGFGGMRALRPTGLVLPAAPTLARVLRSSGARGC